MPHLHFAGVCVVLEGSPSIRRGLERLYAAYLSPDCGQKPVVVTLDATRPLRSTFDLTIDDAWLSFTDEDGPAIHIGPVRDFHQADRLLMHGAAALLGRREALLVHGSAVEDPIGGVAFVGPSGVGKTTAALNCPGRLLHPDRIALGVTNGDCWVSPVPFLYGEPRSGGTDRAPLRLLAFVEKGSRNEMEALPPAQVAARLLAASLMPPDPVVAHGALAAAQQIATRACARILRARRDGGFWGLVQEPVA